LTRSLSVEVVRDGRQGAGTAADLEILDVFEVEDKDAFGIDLDAGKADGAFDLNPVPAAEPVGADASAAVAAADACGKPVGLGDACGHEPDDVRFAVVHHEDAFGRAQRLVCEPAEHYVAVAVERRVKLAPAAEPVVIRKDLPFSPDVLFCCRHHTFVVSYKTDDVSRAKFCLA